VDYGGPDARQVLYVFWGSEWLLPYATGKKLNAAHRRHGELITVMLNAQRGLFAPPASPAGRKGRPQLYSDAVVEALPTVKLLPRLSQRATEGLAAGLAYLDRTRFRRIGHTRNASAQK
jgi:hypothetical protein